MCMHLLVDLSRERLLYVHGNHLLGCEDNITDHYIHPTRASHSQPQTGMYVSHWLIALRCPVSSVDVTVTCKA